MATRYNVVGAFADEENAQLAVHRLTRAGVDERALRLVKPGGNDDPDRVAVMRAEMRDGLSAQSQPMDAVNALFVGTLAGGLVGLVAGVIWALFGNWPAGPAARSLIVFVPLAIVGAVIGAIAGGALRSGVDRLAAERDTIVAVHVSDANTAKRAQHVLVELGAERVDSINADGTPLPPRK